MTVPGRKVEEYGKFGQVISEQLLKVSKEQQVSTSQKPNSHQNPTHAWFKCKISFHKQPQRNNNSQIYVKSACRGEQDRIIVILNRNRV